MPYNNSSCNKSYSQPSYPSYSHPYVHHQNPHQSYGHGHGHGYGRGHGHGYPALSYPGYGYSGQSYGAPSYSSPSYGTPNVFSIIKTSPDTTDDNVCALNSYDTLCLDAGSPDHLTITGDKANKKVTFALKNLIFGTADTTDATETNYNLGAKDRLVTAPTADSANVTIQTLADGDTIKVQSSLVKVNAPASQQNMKMEEGTIEGQKLTLVNVGTENFDFHIDEDTSNVKGSSDLGSRASVAGEGVEMVWISDGSNSHWWVTSGLLS